MARRFATRIGAIRNANPFARIDSQKQNGALLNNTWNYNSHETTTFECPSSTHQGPKVATTVKRWLLHLAIIERYWEANVALTTTAKLQQLRVNSREMTTFAESCNDREMQRPWNDKLETAHLLQLLRQMLRRFVAVVVSSVGCCQNTAGICDENFVVALRKGKLRADNVRISSMDVGPPSKAWGHVKLSWQDCVWSSET